MKEPEKKIEPVQPEENKPIEIAKITEPKTGTYLGMIIFFIILIGVIFGLPYMGDFIDKLKGNTPDEITSPNDNQDNNNNKTPEPDTSKPVAMTGATFKINDIEFSNFSINQMNDYTITFSAITSKEQSISLTDSNIFLELYSANNTLLERIKVEKNIAVAKNTVENLEFKMTENSYNNISNILMVTKTTDDYPALSLNKDGEGNEFLICVNKNQTVTYWFNESKLIKIEDKDTYYQGSDLETYSSLLNNKKTESASIDAREGFVSSVTYPTDGFMVTTTVDLTTATIDKGVFPLYYSKDTTAKIVAFEMRARRYTCN